MIMTVLCRAPSVAPDAFVTTNYHPSTACVMPPMY